MKSGLTLCSQAKQTCLQSGSSVFADLAPTLHGEPHYGDSISLEWENHVGKLLIEGALLVVAVVVVDVVVEHMCLVLQELENEDEVEHHLHVLGLQLSDYVSGVSGCFCFCTTTPPK